MGRLSSDRYHHLRLLAWLFGAVLLLWALAALLPGLRWQWERWTG